VFSVIILIASCSKDDNESGSINNDNKKYGTFTDPRDQHVYKTVKIGNQIWMAENLKTTKYRDGRDILNVTSNIQWSNLSTGAYCYYDNLESIRNSYGLLYNWFAVNKEGIAPSGWHVPTTEDWTILVNYLIANGYNYDGSKDIDLLAKSLASNKGWVISGIVGTPGADSQENNSSEFDALPGGFRNAKGEFTGIGKFGYWWSSNSTKDYGRIILGNKKDLGYSSNGKQCGISVRCIKD
jgi:uncharacterized protein (TIGR02145 family)